MSLALPFLASAIVLAQIPDLNALQWRRRVILLFAPAPEDRLLTEQKRLLEADPKGLAERDLVVYEVTGSSPPAADLRQQWDIEPERFVIVLIGKDGGRKMKKNQPVLLPALYGKIDAMPMRRSEMKKSGER